MKSFLKKRGAEAGVTAPRICRDELLRHFNNPVDEEWTEKGDNLEVIFYHNNIEHIALLSRNGELLEYKHYLQPAQLPSEIAAILPGGAELMNVVVIHGSKPVSYELIYRNSRLRRFLALVSVEGKIMEHRPL